MTLLRTLVPVELHAAAEGKARRFSMTAYTGTAMDVGFSVPVVVDLAGMTVPTQNLPILRDHQLGRVVGHSDRVAKAGDGLAVEGVVSGAGPDAAEVVAAAANGFPWQASIGTTVERRQFVEAGAKAAVNGRTFAGPLVVVRKSTLREISFVAIGADGATSATVAASRPHGDGSMVKTFDEWMLEKGFPLDAGDTQAAVLRAAWRREVADDLIPETGDTAAGVKAGIAAGQFGDDFGRARKLYDTLADRAGSVGRTPGNRPRGGPPDAESVMTASLLASAGMPLKAIAGYFGEAVADAATAKGERGLGIQGVLRRVMAAAGEPPPAGRFTDGTVLRAFEASRRLEASGFSTISLPGILSDSANKLMLESFTAASATWPRVCRKGSNPDFRASNRYRLTALGEFEKVGPAGRIKHITAGESSVETSLDTHAAMLSVTRRDIINDDVGAFSTMPRRLGRLAALAVERAAYAALLANEASFFGSGNANFESGAGSALSAAGLAAAFKRFRNQTDSNGDPTMLEPSILLVPTALEITAKQLMQDVAVVATTTANTPLPAGNPWSGLAEVVVAPYLGTQYGLTGSSDTAWYLLGPVGDFSILEATFLNGMSTPTVESSSMDFDTLGVSMRAYFDFAVTLLEHRGGVKSAGV